MSGFHWHPEVALGLTALLAVYAAGIGPLRRRHRLGPPATPAQAAAFLAGTAVLAGAVTGPLAAWAEEVALSAHMTQHLLMTLVAPPLWLLGTPAWLLRPLTRVPGLDLGGRLLTRPAVALAASSAALVVWHLPRFYEAALRAAPVHALEHLTLVGTAVLFWWPVAGPLPEWPRPAPPARLLYLFLATVPMTAAAAPITLADGLLYPSYAAPAAPWPLAPLADQELAGTLMWMGGMVGYLAAGTIVFFRWAGGEADGDPAAALADPGRLA